MGLVASGVALVAGLAFALVFPFHDQCGKNARLVVCIGGDSCPPVICSGWGLNYRILSLAIAIVIALLAIVIGTWSASWSARQTTSDRRIRA